MNIERKDNSKDDINILYFEWSKYRTNNIPGKSILTMPCDLTVHLSPLWEKILPSIYLTVSWTLQYANIHDDLEIWVLSHDNSFSKLDTLYLIKTLYI